MAYSADTFVADEQPTTAKWNKLWTNDASFNDGTGIADGVIVARHMAEAFFRGRAQANTTNSQPTGLTVQFGWGFIVGDTTSVVEENVTFPTAFASVPIFVMSGTLGARLVASGAPDTIDDFDLEYAGAESPSSFISDTSTSAMKVTLMKSYGTFGNTVNYGYSWIAIGTV